MANTTTKNSNIARRRQLAKENGELEYKQKRAQLVEVAGRVFREKGYEGASINDFAQEVGIDRASIYYYISGKDELFQEIVLSAVTEQVSMVEHIRNGNASPQDKIRTFLISLMHSYEEHYPYLYVFLQEDMARLTSKNISWAKEMRTLTERFYDATSEIVDEGLRLNAIQTSGTSPRLIAFALIGMCAWSHRWFRPAGKMSAEDIGEHFAAMVLNGLLPVNR